MPKSRSFSSPDARMQRRRQLASVGAQLYLNLDEVAFNAQTVARSQSPKALIAIDEAPIRKAHGTAVQRLLLRFSNSRRQLSDYRAIDRPAFGRWVALTFHDELAEAESLQHRLVHARSLTERVEELRDESRATYRQAFEAAVREESAGLREDAARAEDEMDGDDEGESDESPGKDEDDEAFHRERPDFDGFDWGAFAGLREPAPATSNGLSIEVAAKERYRKLVRLLHPDLRPAQDKSTDEWAEELWHQTQAAFRAKDPVQLEALLSIARLRFGDGRDKPLIGEVLTAAEWLRSSISHIGTLVRAAKRDDAWGFAKLKDRSRLKRKIAYQIDDDIEEMRSDVARLEGFLRRCSQSRGSAETRSASSRHSRKR